MPPGPCDIFPPQSCPSQFAPLSPSYKAIPPLPLKTSETADQSQGGQNKEKQHPKVTVHGQQIWYDELLTQVSTQVSLGSQGQGCQRQQEKQYHS
jgi:hypothetical protein